jgi:hypothetical protein
LFDNANLYYLAFLDLLIIMFFYITMSLVYRFISREDEPEEKEDKWLLFFKKYHLFKILYLVMFFFFIQLNLRILNETIFSSSTDLNKFVKLHAWIVGNAAIVIGIFINKIALFQKKFIIKNVHLR